MAPALEKISATLLSGNDGISPQEKWLDCTRRYPWYPLPWLMLAQPAEPASVQKASLWFYDEQRMAYLLHGSTGEHDAWLEAQLAELQKAAPVETSSNATETETLSIETTLADETEPVVSGHTQAEVDSTTERASNPAVSTPQSPSTAVAEPVIPGLRINFNPQDPPKNTPLFEPYYAVDYFASQGIKLKAGLISQDKFDKQLKSFTQWLKTMKKVADTTPAFADPMVEAQAVASNQGKEVLTEAMALVLEKQGSFEKAAAIYEKLLLLHPEKGALFAARIEDLKTKQ